MNRWRIAALAAGALILLAPLVAMQFSDTVAWDGGDFGVLGALLIGLYLAFELLARTTDAPPYRWGAAVALAGAFLLIVSNLAVGIIGSEDNRANLLYAGVLAVGAAGAALARLRPRGMARALLAMALLQAAIGVFALTAGLDTRPQVLLINAFFVGMFGGASLLFSRAAR